VVSLMRALYALACTRVHDFDEDTPWNFPLDARAHRVNVWTVMHKRLRGHSP